MDELLSLLGGFGGFGGGDDFGDITRFEKLFKFLTAQQLLVPPGFPGGGILDGVVPARVEGKEVLETPDGNLLKVIGGTHQSGDDVQVLAVPGTKVFSDRIKVRGKSMANRKVDRDERRTKRINHIKTLLKQSNKRGKNIIDEFTIDRSIQGVIADEAIDGFQDKTDMNIQRGLATLEEVFAGGDFSGDEFGKGGKIKKKRSSSYPHGGEIGDPFFLATLISQLLEERPRDTTNITPPGDPIRLNTPSVPSVPTIGARTPSVIAPHRPLVDRATVPSLTPLPARTPRVTRAPRTLTGGAVPGAPPPPEDIDFQIAGQDLHRIGTGVSALSPLVTTLVNRAGDQRVPNFFQDTGNQALGAIGQAISTRGALTTGIADDITLAANAQRRSNRENTRSGSVRNALDISTTGGAQRAIRGAGRDAALDISSLQAERARLLNSVETTRAEGATSAFDERERQRDQFFTNLSSSLSSFGVGIQQLGNLKAKEANIENVEELLNSDLFKLLIENIGASDIFAGVGGFNV